MTYSHTLHNDIYVNNGPHLQWWAHKITMELKNSYCPVTLEPSQHRNTKDVKINKAVEEMEDNLNLSVDEDDLEELLRQVLQEEFQKKVLL